MPVAAGAGGGLDAELQATVYRVVQEALTNTAKHARARSARVALQAVGDRLVLEIADDGHGFDTEQQGGGFGLTGMRERVLVFGGELTVESSEGGTTVSAWLPLGQALRLPLAVASKPRRSA